MDSDVRNVEPCNLQFSADLNFDYSDGDKTAKVKIMARSSEPLEHPYWGRVVHDMEGMQLSKSRIPLDYNHDADEIVGYLNHFNHDSEGLHVNGVLTPFSEQDRASEIIYKMAQGVPYEASINFGGPGITVEEVPAGASVLVNGFEFQGPGSVVRSWPLRGVAICPYGADPATRAMSFSSDSVSVHVKETDMSNEQKVEAVEAEVIAQDSAVETVETVDTAEEISEVSVEAEVVEEPAEQPVPAATALSDRASEGKRFLEAFGDSGGVWFAEGLSFDDAQLRYIEMLEQKVNELSEKANLSAAGDSGAEFSEAVPQAGLDVAKYRKSGLSQDASKFAAVFERRFSGQSQK